MGEASNRSWRSILSVCLGGLGILGLLAGAPAAGAAPVAIPAFAYSHSFASEFQISPPFNSTSNIGIDPSTGDVVVMNGSGQNFQVYAPDSTPSSAPLVTFAENELWSEMAVAPNGDVYASNTTELGRFARDGGDPPGYTRDATFSADVAFPPVSEGPRFTVDPTTGDLLVVEAAGVEAPERIVRLTPEGERISSFPVAGGGETLVSALAAADDGTIFVFDARAKALRRFSPTGQLLGIVKTGGNVLSLGSDPIHHGVVAAVGFDAGPPSLKGYDASGELLFEAPLADGTEAAPMGIAIDATSGRLYAYTSNPPGVEVFEPAVYPGVSDPVVSGVTTEGAHVSAEVDPGAGPPDGSFANFEFSADGGVTWTSTPPQDDTAGPTIETDLTGLEPNLEYLVRAVAGNDQISHVGASTSFRTASVPPIAMTGAAGTITETGAVLNGTVNPLGSQSTFFFEYGPTTAYGNRAPTSSEAIAGNGRQPLAVSRPIAGLLPNTTYHYRLVAKNSAGADEGEDRTFTTAAVEPAPGRFYEQVTPADKGGGAVDFQIGFQVGTDGSNLSYVIRSGAGAIGAPLMGRWNSVRAEGDWINSPVDPPLNVSRQTVFASTLAVSEDFTHSFAASNRALTPGAVENGANLYLIDHRTGGYTLVASSAEAGAFDSYVGGNKVDKFVYGSPDLSTIVFISKAPLLPEAANFGLYRWTVGGGLELLSRLPDGSAPTAEVARPPGTGSLRMVSEDGDRVYFTLDNGPEAGVYLRENDQTRAISVSHRPGDPVVPQAGAFLGSNPDGRYAFFATRTAPLTEDAPNAPNTIYRYDALTEEIEYIGSSVGDSLLLADLALGVSDDGGTFYFTSPKGIEVWRDGQLDLIRAGFAVGSGNAYSSADGDLLAFAETGEFEGDRATIQLYDAERQETVCVGCNLDGSDTGGGFLPYSQRQVSNQIPTPFDRNGALFFTAGNRLDPADTNGVDDVYEYKDGRYRLITPGDQNYPTRFAAVSEDGRDVYFTTAQGLVARDRDEVVDIYDARIGGGLPSQNSLPAPTCRGEACAAPPSAAPPPPTQASEAAGQSAAKHKGSVRRCPKGKKPKHGSKSKCVKRHKKHATRHGNSSKQNRGQNR